MLAADEIAEGYDGGTWDGQGIVSSVAGGDVAVGYGEASDVGIDELLGLPGSPDAYVFIAPTVVGDADVNRTVNLADFGRLRAGFGSGSLWAEGDSNYDGSVNLADFGLLRANFGGSYSTHRGGEPVRRSLAPWRLTPPRPGLAYWPVHPGVWLSWSTRIPDKDEVQVRILVRPLDRFATFRS